MVQKESLTFEEMKGLPEDEQAELFAKIHSKRQIGKTVSYASVYNAGPATIARAAKVSEEEGKKLHEGYWKLHWSVKAIADEQYTIKCDQGLTWLVNPVNGFCYSLRKESDKFSTLCQGTGSYIFDMWVDNTLKLMQDNFGKKKLTFCAHDEQVLVFRDKPKNREVMEQVMYDAIEGVNTQLDLRRSMGCDVAFGDNYAEVH